jgi:hypothetical protein
VAVETCAIPPFLILTKKPSEFYYTPIMVVNGALYEWRVIRSESGRGQKPHSRVERNGEGVDFLAPMVLDSK